MLKYAALIMDAAITALLKQDMPRKCKWGITAASVGVSVGKLRMGIVQEMGVSTSHVNKGYANKTPS